MAIRSFGFNDNSEASPIKQLAVFRVGDNVRIAAISVAPLFPDQVIGGSQKILADLAVGLKSRGGHDIEIWCTGTDAHSGDFEIGDVPVHPELKLSGSFPSTHQVSPHALAQTSDALRRAAEWANRVYLHADAVYLRHALEGKQIVRSIHDYVYEEALVSTLALPADTTVVPSEYLKRCIEATVALSGRTTIEPVLAIPNGIELPDLESEIASQLPDGIPPREDDDLILLFPHRPEPTKGVREAISTAVSLQQARPENNVRLLMPSYPSNSNFDSAAGTSSEISNLIKELDATEIVELHGWLNPSQMPSYYAAGDVTLCLGSFIESFGLVPIESVAAGTPVVASMVGALREFSDIQGIMLVPFGDVLASTHAVLRSLATSESVLDSARAMIAEKYPAEKMISEFESVITRSLSGERRISRPDNNRLALAPWCAVLDNRVYNDYTASFKEFPELIRALEIGSGLVSSDPLLLSASLDAEVRFAVEHGILIPEFVIK
jgi:glycosyltransferase involved in cell wall biosynthesis